jgi:hypothetical protein
MDIRFLGSEIVGWTLTVLEENQIMRFCEQVEQSSGFIPLGMLLSPSRVSVARSALYDGVIVTGTMFCLGK